MADRYRTASDLADDLKHAIDERRPAPASLEPILYKGLTPFDVEDAKFFLALLPGPRRGDGMPESIRFWKDRVESVEGTEGLQRGRTLRPIRRRQVVVRQSGSVAQSRPRPRPAGLHRGDAWRYRGAALGRAAPRGPGSAGRRQPSRCRGARCARTQSTGQEENFSSSSTSSSNGSRPTPTSPTPSWCGRSSSVTAGELRPWSWCATTSGWP